MNKNYTSKAVFLVLFFLCCTFGYSQERTCGMLEHMQEMMADPEFAREYERNQQKFREKLEQILASGEFENRGSQVIVPVAVHFPTGNEADRACLEALAQNQIDILNADYTATNADIATWTGGVSTLYPGVFNGITNVSFCIALSNHPPGLDPELIEGNPAVTIGYNFGGGNNQDANWAGYMNFVVRPIGALGFSPLGGSIAAGQAVTMDVAAFGSGAGCPGSGVVPGAPYNLGRTTTHELGHFYNLGHTFNGDGGGTCGFGGDGIADTPEVANSTYGCPAAGSVAGCGALPSLTMNYMDYVNDACMYMFTAGQTAIMDAYLAAIESDFAVGVCNPAGPTFALAGSDISTCADVAVFDITYTQIAGFSETTTFGASGQPAGSSIVVNPTSLDADGSFTVTVDNLNAATNGDYTISISATSASESKNLDLTLTVTDDLCTSVANTAFQTSTTGVVFNTISNLNTGKPSGYSDYTAQSTDVNQESSYDLTVNANSDGNYQIITYAWFDWNQNCSFDDPGEQYDLGTSANINNLPTSNSPLSITIPDDAALGNTIMRITTKYTPPGANDFPTSCENNHDAEVEDYTINVLSSLSVGENEFDNFAIFPNPNKGQFTIKLNSYSGNDIAVDVHDIRGRRIFKNAFDAASDFEQVISLNSVQSGMYLVTVNDGQRKVTKRIVIE